MYPVNLRLKGQPVVIIGGGRIATRKLRGLLAAGACVTVVSPTLAKGIDTSALCWRKQWYTPDVLAGAKLIFACTDDAAVNQQVVADAQWYQWVDNVSDKTQADFYNMATLTHHEVTLGVSTDGQDPAASRRIKQALDAWLEQEGSIWK